MNAPIIVTATFAAADMAWLDGLRRRHFPPERNVLNAHLTMFHHLPPGVEAELRHRLADATRGASPPACVTGPMSLGRGTALRVASDGLRAIRDQLANQFSGLLVPQDAGGWRPHVTIQNKVDVAAAKSLLAALSAEAWPRPLAIAGIAAWWYRGGPWEPLREWRFRG